MKQFIAILLLVVVLFAVAVYCQTVDKTAMEEVSEALSKIGYDVAVTEETQDFLHGQRHRLVLEPGEGRAVTVYVYKNADEAKKEAGYITADGFGLDYIDKLGNGQGVRVEWIAAPHFFLYQNVIVQYIGTDENILAALQNLCGEQIAGSPFRQDTPSCTTLEPWMSQPAPDAPEVFLEVLPDSVRSDSLTMRLVNNSNLSSDSVDVEYGEVFSLLQKMTMISCGVSKADENQAVSETIVTWEPVAVDWAFDDLAYSLPVGAQVELQVALPDLAPGEYRITKNILYQQNGESDYASFEVYADFAVSDKK